MWCLYIFYLFIDSVLLASTLDTIAGLWRYINSLQLLANLYKTQGIYQPGKPGIVREFGHVWKCHAIVREFFKNVAKSWKLGVCEYSKLSNNEANKLLSDSVSNRIVLFENIE